MTDAFVPKYQEIGHGYAEMPYNGRRYRFEVKQYVNDAGERYGEIMGMTEIPETGQPYVWIPSFGVEGRDEMEYLKAELQEEQRNPHPLDAEWWAEHRARTQQMRNLYDEARDERAKRAGKNTFKLFTGGS